MCVCVCVCGVSNCVCVCLIVCVCVCLIVCDLETSTARRSSSAMCLGACKSIDIAVYRIMAVMMAHKDAI